MRVIPDQMNDNEREQIANSCGIFIDRWCLIFESEDEAIEYMELLEQLKEQKS